MSKLSENNTSRLASLDILRGFDLFLLVFFQPVFAALARQLNLPFLNVRQLLARLSEDSEAGVSAVYFRNDCSGKSAWTGQQSYLSLFKYFAVYCCRLFYCGSHSVPFFPQVADRNHFIVAFHILDSHDIFG